MTVFINETFTAANGTFLPTYSAAYAELPFDLSGTATSTRHSINSNRFTADSTQSPGPQIIRCSTDPGADEYDVTATLAFRPTAQAGRYHALFVRLSPSSTDYSGSEFYSIFAATNLTPENWQLSKRVGGVTTVLDTADIDNQGTTVTVLVQVRASGVQVFRNGVLILETTDTAVTQRGRVGFASRRGDASVHYIEDLTADSVASGGTPVNLSSSPGGVQLGGPSSVDVVISTLLTASPDGIRSGGLAGTLRRGVRISSTAAAARISGLGGTLTVSGDGGVATTSTAAAVRLGGPSGALRRGVRVTTTAGNVQLAGPAAGASTGVTLTDPPGSVILGGARGQANRGVTLTGAPGGLSLGAPTGALLFDVTLTATPGGLALGGTAGTLTAAGPSAEAPTGRLTLASLTSTRTLTSLTPRRTLVALED